MVNIGETAPLLRGRRSGSLRSAVVGGLAGIIAVALCFSAVAIWHAPNTVLVGKASSGQVNHDPFRKQLDLARRLWTEGHTREIEGKHDLAEAR